MDTQNALTIFDCLSQETRLEAFRLLVKAGPGGRAAGELGKELGIAHNTLSFHLGHLVNAGLAQSRKEGRSVIYSAAFSAMHDLIDFMVRDCCSEDFASISENKRSGTRHIELGNCC